MGITWIACLALGACGEKAVTDTADSESPPLVGELHWSEVYPELKGDAALEFAVNRIDRRWEHLQDSGALWDAIVARHEGQGAEAVLARALGLDEESDCKPRAKWGTFEGKPDFEPPVKPGEFTTLMKPFVFEDTRKGQTRVAPVPSANDPWIWDGASIPPFLRWAAGKPRDGCYAIASIHHDYYYKSRKVGKPGRRKVDRIFYRGMRANGVGKWKARSFYWAVWTFGWRSYQSVNGSAEETPAYVATDEEFLDDWIEVSTLCYLDALEHPDEDGGGLTLEDLENLTSEEVERGFALTR